MVFYTFTSLSIVVPSKRLTTVASQHISLSAGDG